MASGRILNVRRSSKFVIVAAHLLDCTSFTTAKFPCRGILLEGRENPVPMAPSNS